MTSRHTRFAICCARAGEFRKLVQVKRLLAAVETREPEARATELRGSPP